MAAYYATKDQTLLDALEELYKQFGYYKEALVSKVFEGKDGQEQMIAILNSYRENTPTKIADTAIVRVEDYLTGVATLKDGTTEGIFLPRENVLKFVLEDQSWIAIRPSGTEPKCKFYFGVVRETEAQATEVLKKLKSSILE